MGIEINNTPNLGISDTQGNKTSETKKVDKDAQGTAAAQSQNNPAATDSVHLTASARQLSELENRLEKIPEVDSNRVEAIKKAIANGEYKIDAERIATKLTNLESLLPR